MIENSLFPKELTSHIPVVILTGDQLVRVEQHRGIYAYHPDEIILRTAIGLLKIAGKNLNCKRYTSAEVLIAGTIDSILFKAVEQ